MARKSAKAQKTAEESMRQNGRAKHMMRRGSGIAAATAALAATAAGAFYFYGKQGRKNRERVKDWASEAKENISEATDNLIHRAQKRKEKLS